MGPGIAAPREAGRRRGRWRLAGLFALLAPILLVACAQQRQPMGEPVRQARLAIEHNITDPLAAGVFETADGVDLPIGLWQPEADRPAEAVIVAAHGVNDYARFLHIAGPWLAERGVIVLAYDQRGFGRSTTEIGIWPGTETLVADLAAVSAAAHARWPDLPLFLLGESMGGAVLLSALDRGAVAAPGEDGPAESAVDPDGIVLIAPAIWARETMPLYQRWALWLGANLTPGLTVGPDGLDIWPSDNLPMLVEHSADPHVVRDNRIDLLAGLVDLMDEAYAVAPGMLAADRAGPPVLMTYGDQEQVLYPEPLARFFARLAAGGALPETAADAGRASPAPAPRVVTPEAAETLRLLFAFYPESYHMMLRDTVAQIVLRDIRAFIDEPTRRDLPSGFAYRPRGPSVANPPPPTRNATGGS